MQCGHSWTEISKLTRGGMSTQPGCSRALGTGQRISRRTSSHRSSSSRHSKLLSERSTAKARKDYLKRVPDDRVFKVLQRIVSQPMGKGILQGHPIAPLLANLFLWTKCATKPGGRGRLTVKSKW